ncbi:MAG TPA: glycosyltransferase family 2 protein [Polyangiaceae bacterium]|nr:glycosyltransferase family 2 protein [Polyangiaceae bacterium]
MTSAPEVSFVIPVYNEEAILHAAVVDLRERLAPHDLTYELILAENGSSDRTADIARELCGRYPELRLEQSPKPNYGHALRHGIAKARGDLIICEEIDLCDVDFHLQALELLRQGRADFVIGSKLIGGARDARPLFRHGASMLYTGVLRALFDFRGTDTHGLKAFRRALVQPLVDACQVERDVFASELVLRAYRSPIRVVEIPVRILEKRPPSVGLWRRMPGVLRDLWQLTRSIRG